MNIAITLLWNFDHRYYLCLCFCNLSAFSLNGKLMASPCQKNTREVGTFLRQYNRSGLNITGVAKRMKSPCLRSIFFALTKISSTTPYYPHNNMRYRQAPSELKPKSAKKEWENRNVVFIFSQCDKLLVTITDGILWWLLTYKDC